MAKNADILLKSLNSQVGKRKLALNDTNELQQVQAVWQIEKCIL